MPVRPAMRVETGLDRVAAGDPDALRVLRGKKLGLLAHPASVDRRLRHAHAVLLEAGCDVRALFGPEHGYGGEAQDMIAVRSEHAARGLPVHSLYGASEEDAVSEAGDGSTGSMPWSSTCRTSAAATTRSCGRWHACCAAPQRGHRARSCSIARTRSAARSSRAARSGPAIESSSACTTWPCATA